MRRRAHALLLAMLLVGLASPVAEAAGWRDGNLHAGGYVVVTRWHPSDSRHVLLGTDVGGLHVSDDGGLTWHLRGTAQLAGKGKRIADVAWHPTKPNVAYALVGDGPADTGAVLASTDFGWTWQRIAAGVAGAGNHVVAGDGLSDAHPRSIGRLLAVDAGRNLLYVGTYDAGIVRLPLAPDGTAGGAWTTIAMASGGTSDRSFVRGIAMDDTDPSTLYVATAQGVSVRPPGTWRIRDANQASPLVELLDAGPANPEELDVLDGNLYAVANPSTLSERGLYRLAGAANVGTNAAWRRVQTPASTDSATSFYGLEAERRGMQTRIWVTVDDAWRVGSNPEGYHAILRGESLDGFASEGTWASLPNQRTDAPNDVGGPAHVGVPDAFWKFGVPSNGVYCWLGYDPQYTASAVAIDPNDGDTVVLAGQCTAWRSTNAGATWFPVPEGIQLLVNTRIAADPDAPGRAFIASADMRGFSTTDAFANPQLLGIKADIPGVDSAANNAHALWIDQAADPNATYLAFGDSSLNTRGYLVRNLDPFGAGNGTWETLLTPSDTALGADQGKRVDGVGVVYDPADPTTAVVLVSVQNGGIWRKVGSGAWTKASGFVSSGYEDYPATVQFAWRPGMTKVYVYDRETGLWRSDDYGANWTKVLTTPSGSNNRQGSLAVHPTNQDVVYLATYPWVRSVTNAGTAATNGGTTLNLGFEFVAGSGIGRPGAIAISPNGRIYVSTTIQQSPTPAPGRIWRATADPSGAGIVGGWTDVSDNTWRAMATDIAELSVGPDETVYAAQGNATMVLDGGVLSSDVVGPTITRTSPASTPHAWSGPVTATWDVEDPSGIELVTFRLDGLAIDARHAAPYSITLDPTDAVVGSHQVQVIARDQQGNESSSTLDLVKPAPDTTPPTITRTAPASSPYTWSSSVAATFTATDASGVSRVEYRLDGALLETDAAPPFSVTLDPAGRADGAHQLDATAVDDAGNTATSTLALTKPPSPTPPPPPPPPPPSGSDPTATPIPVPETTAPVAVSPTAVAPVLSWPSGANATSWTIWRELPGDAGTREQLATIDTTTFTDTGLIAGGTWRYLVMARSAASNGEVLTIDVTYDPVVPTPITSRIPVARTSGATTVRWSLRPGSSGISEQVVVAWTRPSDRPDLPLRQTRTIVPPDVRSWTLRLAPATTTCVAIVATSGSGVASVPAPACSSTPAPLRQPATSNEIRLIGRDLVFESRRAAVVVPRRGARSIVVFTRACRTCGAIEVLVDGRATRIDAGRGRGVVATRLPAGRASRITVRGARGMRGPVRIVGIVLLRG